MSNSIRTIVLLTFLIAIILGCSNHDSVPNLISKMPVSDLVSSKEISIYKYNSPYNGAALGFEFKVKANGYIAGLGCASPAIGNYTLTLFKVDTVNKTGTMMTTLPISITASDTINFKFKYATLSNKVSVSKDNYYRVAMNGDFNAYDYMVFAKGSNFAFPLTLPDDPNVVFTKGVSGYASSYPDTEFANYMFPADVVIQFP